MTDPIDDFLTVKEFVALHRGRWSYPLVTKMCREGRIGFCASHGPNGKCGKWMVERTAMERVRDEARKVAA